MAHRFYVPPDRISDGAVTFTDEQRKQIKNVLRLSPGDNVNVFDGSGKEYATSLKSIGNEAVGEVVSTCAPSTEPSMRITLVQGIPKGEKLEFILQKCTEIGVSEFIIVSTERSVPKISAQKLPSRLERWRAIAKEAAEQSGRVRVPSIEGVLTLKETFARYPHGLIAWEKEAEHSIGEELRAGNREETTLFIGPEGGFSAEEIDLAVRHGITPISLGRRILRTETAAIVGSAILIYETEKSAVE
jgi:16S rRNA (uracil1498-N3)-methyltransferase